MLRDEGFEPEVFFYNPNIHPYKEYLRRKSTFLQFAREMNIKAIIEDEFNQNEWENFKPEDKSRCTMCYMKRLDKTAQFAKQCGYDFFTSTLFVSPYQDHLFMKGVSEQLQEKYDIPFLYRDFRTGYRKGQSKAREMGLYRQKYCGCIHSYNMSEFKDKITWDDFQDS